MWGQLRDIFLQRTRAEWVDLFVTQDIAGGPVNTAEEMISDPHFVSRENTYRADYHGTELTFVGSPVRVVGEFPRDVPPDLGGTEIDVLQRVAGYSPAVAKSFNGEMR